MDMTSHINQWSKMPPTEDTEPHVHGTTHKVLGNGYTGDHPTESTIDEVLEPTPPEKAHQGSHREEERHEGA